MASTVTTEPVSASEASKVWTAGISLDFSQGQFVRDNWLSNRVFFSYDNILDHCCDAWNKLVDQPWTIMSIGLRDWAHRF